MTDQLKALAAHYLPALEAEIQEILSLNHVDTAPVDTGRDRFYEMIHYHMGWLNAQLEADSDGRSRGKRIRPLLCLLVCDAVGGSWEQALPAAAAVEILHNFTLVHDDIEDASPTRHGRPTVWQLWGEPQAINVGDAMFALSHLALTRLADCSVDAAVVVRALRRFDETCLRLTEGQHADMSFEQMDTVSVDAYLHMITGKTAVLLGLCGELGALVGGGDEEAIRHYAAFGEKLGLAFQVKDDILGIWGDEALTGKSAATDIKTGKKSLPVLYGLSRSEQLRSLYAHPNGPALSLSNGNDGYVRQVVSLLDESGAYDFAAEKATEYSRSALDHLEAAQPAGAAGKALYQLTEMLLTRNF